LFDQNNPKNNAVQKGAPAAGLGGGQIFKWRIELSQNFKQWREILLEIFEILSCEQSKSNCLHLQI
jgi:hypothetical protein